MQFLERPLLWRWKLCKAQISEVPPKQNKHFFDGQNGIWHGGERGNVQAHKAKEVGRQSHKGSVMGTKGVDTRMQGAISTTESGGIMEVAMLTLI